MSEPKHVSLAELLEPDLFVNPWCAKCRDQGQEMARRLKALDALHAKTQSMNPRGACWTCGPPWPCPTSRILEGESL